MFIVRSLSPQVCHQTLYVSSLSLTYPPLSCRGYVTSLKLSPNLRKVPKVSQEIHQVSHGRRWGGGLVTSILEGCQYTRGYQYTGAVSIYQGVSVHWRGVNIPGGISTLERCQYTRGYQYTGGVSIYQGISVHWRSVNIPGDICILEGCQYTRGYQYTRGMSVYQGVSVH